MKWRILNQGIVVGAALLLAVPARSAADPVSTYETQARVESVANEANVKAGASLKEGAEVRTGVNGSLRLQLGEGSTVELKSKTEIKLESLHDPQNQPLIWVRLKRGEITVHMAPFDSYRSFSVYTGAAMLIVDEGAPVFSVKENGGLTTLAVEEGVVMIQTENPEIQPINLGAGEQVSLNLNKMGPIVAAGTPPGLGEPKELVHKLLDLGPLQVCEMKEGEKEICGGWTWDRKAQQFNATWQNGAEGVLKVEKMGGGEIILTRRDTAGASAGLTARYTGRNAGGDIEGDVAIQLLAGTVTWEQQGKTSAGTWRTRSAFFLDLGTPETLKEDLHA